MLEAVFWCVQFLYIDAFKVKNSLSVMNACSLCNTGDCFEQRNMLPWLNSDIRFFFEAIFNA